MDFILNANKIISKIKAKKWNNPNCLPLKKKHIAALWGKLYGSSGTLWKAIADFRMCGVNREMDKCNLEVERTQVNTVFLKADIIIFKSILNIVGILYYFNRMY